MTKYKPIHPIEAFQWDGTTQSLLDHVAPNHRGQFYVRCNWLGDFGVETIWYLDKVDPNKDDLYQHIFDTKRCYINDPDCQIVVNQNDYLIQAANGRYTKMAPDTFEATYQQI